MPTIFRVLLLVFLGWSAGAHARTQPFVNDTLSDIVASRHNRPFLLVLWSVDCAACRKDFKVLARVLESNPELDVVVVSTDSPNAAARVEAALSESGLGHLESYLFSDSHAERLRYSIDPTWYGELPRSYFYGANNERLAHSGILTEEQLRAWGEVVASHP